MPELRGSPPPPEIERREGLTKEARLGGRESGRRVVKHVRGSDVLYDGDIKDDKCGRSRETILLTRQEYFVLKEDMEWMA